MGMSACQPTTTPESRPSPSQPGTTMRAVSEESRGRGESPCLVPEGLDSG